jgi:hypothetical protein
LLSARTIARYQLETSLTSNHVTSTVLLYVRTIAHFETSKTRQILEANEMKVMRKTVLKNIK